MYVSNVADSGEQAMAGGLFNCMTMVGTSIGLAINTIIQARVTEGKVAAEGGLYDPNQVGGLKSSPRMLLCAALADTPSPCSEPHPTLSKADLEARSSARLDLPSQVRSLIACALLR